MSARRIEQSIASKIRKAIDFGASVFWDLFQLKRSFEI